jgi:hypothetical protein
MFIRYIIQFIVIVAFMQSTFVIANTDVNKSGCVAGDNQCLVNALKQPLTHPSADNQLDTLIQRAFSQNEANPLSKSNTCDVLAKADQTDINPIENTELSQLMHDIGNGKLLSSMLLLINDSNSVAPSLKADQLAFNAINNKDYDAISQLSLNCKASEVPVPAAAWLFGSALFGFVSLSSRRKI